ncbi:MAG: lipoate--protein ligase [Prevotellaceae bacterium]|nr:lipoate--protein ligase [Prevotellaceae bacterium]MDD6780243.1 lipoate--protein ligase [Prevotellaceae bacterium]
MKYVALPVEKVRRLSFYLAMEEYVARRIDEQDLFFMWQVEPSVIFGRNQLIENEVNLKFCRERGIKTYRRKSGGGCVYADMNNVMFSYVTKDEAVGFTFNRYINMVVLVLQNLGVDAKASGRNDVMIGDRKVSGNAFYHIPGRSIVHGTMLYDTDMVNMVGAITPTDEKLLSKGVASVRQRIALLKDYINLDIEQFKTFVRNNLCQGEIVLNEEDIRGIEEIEKDYLTDEFIYGNNPKYTIVRKRRIETVGDFEVRIEMKNGEIKGMVMLGDYFIVGDIDDTILRPLKGVRLEREALEKALPEQLDTAILNLRKADFIDLLL